MSSIFLFHHLSPLKRQRRKFNAELLTSTIGAFSRLSEICQYAPSTCIRQVRCQELKYRRRGYFVSTIWGNYNTLWLIKKRWKKQEGIKHKGMHRDNLTAFTYNKVRCRKNYLGAMHYLSCYFLINGTLSSRLF